MEADWEFDVGGDSPVIDALWSGFVDLRIEPQRAAELLECHRQPGLAEALVRLNSPASPVWTCKSDVFDPGHVDPDELDAGGDSCRYTLSCYIDMLPSGNQPWDSPSEAEAYCRLLCSRLKLMTIHCCRVDLIIRRAQIPSDSDKLGVTAYITACGSELDLTRAHLGRCVAAFAAVVAPAV